MTTVTPLIDIPGPEDPDSDPAMSNFEKITLIIDNFFKRTKIMENR